MPATSVSEIQLFEAAVSSLLRQLFCHKIRWIALALHFRHPNLLLAHSLLNPEKLDTNMARLAESPTLGDGQRSAGVGHDGAIEENSHAIGRCHHAQHLARAPDDAI